MVNSKKLCSTLILIVTLMSSVYTQEDVSELREHVDSVCSEPEHKHFSKTTLAFITPWNLNGLELSLKYSAKFDYISPCWFNIMPETLQGKFNTKVKIFLKILTLD